MKFYVDEFSNPLPRSPSHYFRASSSKLYLQPLFQNFADVYNLHLTKSKESNRRLLSRHVLKNISDRLTLALFHRRKYQSDVFVGHDCGYTDKYQEGTGGAKSTKSADKGTVVLSSNHASDKTSVCCMDLQAVVLTPTISRKQNCVFITLLSTTSPQRMFRLPMG